MSPVRRPQHASVIDLDVEVERRDVDDAQREQALVKLLAELVRRRRARQR